MDFDLFGVNFGSMFNSSQHLKNSLNKGINLNYFLLLRFYLNKIEFLLQNKLMNTIVTKEVQN